MAYIFRQQLTISELVDVPVAEPLVLVVEPEDYLARLYQKVLAEHGFAVRRSSQTNRAVELVRKILPRLLLINPSSQRRGVDVAIVRAVAAEMPGMPIVTIGWEHSAGDLKSFLNAGVTSHINRRLTRPRDIALVVKAILRN